VSATVAWSTVLASTAYDLRYRAIGAPDWTELDGLAGNSTTLNGLVPCSDMEVQMRSSCGGQTADWSATAVVHIPGCGQCVEGNFCNSAGDATYEWIANVHLAGIDRTSGADGGYAGVDATNQSTALSIGATYPISLAPGYSGSLFAEYFTVWMDLDHNGQFTADEKVLDAGSAVTAALNDSLAVPATATPGSTRMRVVMKYQTPPASGCGTYDFGESEDYCITLTNGPVAVADREGTADVRLYPVPADRSFSLTTAHPGALQLVLSDATGRTVLRQAVINGRCTVDVASLGSGLYHFQLLSGAAILGRGHVIVAH
jgi:hypothetical protein